MAQVLVTDTNLTNIADAIRTKNGTSTTYKPGDMDSAILALPGWKLVASKEFEVSTTSTSASSAGTIAVSDHSTWTDAKIVYVRIRDKAGARAGHFLGSDTFFINYQAANSSTSSITYAARIIHRLSTSSVYGQYVGATTTGYGVYAYSITSSGTINVYKRYNSSYSLTIDGTYLAEVYLLDYPDGVSPFDI